LLYSKNKYQGVSITKNSEGGYYVTADEGYRFYSDFEPIEADTISQAKAYANKEISYKMSDGGMMAKGGSIKVGDIVNLKGSPDNIYEVIDEREMFGNKFKAYRVKSLFSEFGGDKKGTEYEYSEDKLQKHIMASGGALETKLKKKLGESFELPMEVAVYVPSTEKANVIISKKEFTNRVEEVEKYLSNLFGGYSAVSVDGGYMSDEKGLIQEDVARVASFGGKADFESKFQNLLRQVTKWGADWGQESMGLEFEGDMFYIDSNAKFKDGGMMAKGGIFDKIKHYGKKGLEKTKQGYGKAKEYTKKQIHDQKKKITLDVLAEMGMRENVSRKEEEKIVNPAYDLVYDRYAKGGKLSLSDKIRLREIEKQIKEQEKTIKEFEEDDTERDYDRFGNPSPLSWNQRVVMSAEENLEKLQEERENLLKGKNIKDGVTNKYLGKSEKQIWDNWTNKQREHFLLDHKEEIGLKINALKLYVNYNWDDLYLTIKKAVKNHIEKGSYAKGGVTFDDKVQSISKSLLKRKKVSPKVQKDYGKTYNKKEAIESAKRIAGSIRKKEMGKEKK
jgi:hypothetical protein